jgi:DNA (cytosine-5)-methyltransferase 1
MPIPERGGEALNELALFAGAGGGILAGKLLGWRTVCAVEIDRYRRRILAQRQDDGILEPFPIWDDIRTFDGLPWRGRVDVVSGGFPCQAYSSAARGRNVADDLWPEMRRVVAEVAPRHVFAENVARRAIDAAAYDLEAMGYETRCIALAASDLGADHGRKRYWLSAHAHGDSELCGPVDAKVGMLPSLYGRVWSAEPGSLRASDGLADRLDRIGAAGDGQVAAVAAAAWQIMNALSRSESHK